VSICIGQHISRFDRVTIWKRTKNFHNDRFETWWSVKKAEGILLDPNRAIPSCSLLRIKPNGTSPRTSPSNQVRFCCISLSGAYAVLSGSCSIWNGGVEWVCVPFTSPKSPILLIRAPQTFFSLAVENTRTFGMKNVTELPRTFLNRISSAQSDKEPPQNECAWGGLIFRPQIEAPSVWGNGKYVFPAACASSCVLSTDVSKVSGRVRWCFAVKARN
jgi:hypothetical protein